MEKLFQYSRLLKKLYYASSVLLLLSCIIILRVNLHVYTDLANIKSLVAMLVSISVPLSLWVRLHFFVRPRVFSTYVLGDNKVLKRFKNNLVEMDFDNVKSISRSWLTPKFGGGYYIHLHSGHKLGFFSLLENNYIILDELLAKRPDLLPVEKSKKFILKMRTSGQFWLRIISRLKIWQLSLIKFLIPQFVGAFYVVFIKNKIWLDELSRVENFILIVSSLFLMSLLIELILLQIEDFYYLHKFKGEKNFSVPSAIEKSLYLFIQAFYFVLLSSFLYFICF